MKAASPSGPHSNSHRRHGYTTNHATSWTTSKSVSTSSHASPKMVMPPFLRLDSTGEVSDDRLIGAPSSEGQQHKASTGGSNTKPQSNKMVSGQHHHAAFTAHHLTSPQTQGRISALDDLINSSQAFNSVAKRAMRSPVKMAHQSHSAYQRSNNTRYGQWGGVIGQHYPYFPPGVFPCHMFSPLYIPSTSGQGVHKAAWFTGMNLMNTCEQFAAQHYHPVPSVTRTLCNRSASCSPQRDSKSFSSPSPVVSGQSVAGRVVHEKKATEATMTPPICSSTGVQPAVEGRPKPTVAEDSSIYGMSSTVPENHAQDNSPADSTIPTCCVESTSATVPTCTEELATPTPSTTSTLAEPLPSSIHEKRVNDVFSCTAVGTKPQVNQYAASANSDVSMSKGAENQSENQDNSHSHSNKLSQFSRLESDDLEVDWDDDDTDQCDAIDEASQAEAWNSFQFGLLHENSLLCKPKKELEKEEDGAQQVKSPPKPDHAANQRWNLHHAVTVPSDRKSKVQFACGEDVDQVHLFERDTMTMMEIQKLRDVSRANEGRAGQILRRKRQESTSDEEDASGTNCAVQKSDRACHADSCRGAACCPSEVKKGSCKGVRGEDCVDGGKARADDDSDDDEEEDLMFAVIGCAVSAESESERDDDDDEWEEEDEDEEDDGFVITFE